VVHAAGVRDRYTFGTGSIAAERLHLVARVFEPALAALLDAVGTGRPDHRVGCLVDLGCGPGSSTGSLAHLVVADHVVGIDASPEFVAEAAGRLPDARFLVGDVTEPWPVERPDLVYARCLLAHLARPVDVARRWREQLAPGGLLLLEEPEAIDTDIEVYRRYLEITQALVASRGAQMYAGRELRGRFADALVDRPFILDVAPEQASALFSMNLASWRHDPWVAAHVGGAELDRLDAALSSPPEADAPAVRWTVRQVALGGQGRHP
jgi:SAM-dependent methyltransferase